MYVCVIRGAYKSSINTMLRNAMHKSRSVRDKRMRKFLFLYVQIRGHKCVCVCNSSKMTAGPTDSGPIDISDHYPRSVTSVVHPSVSSGVEYLLFLFFFSTKRDAYPATTYIAQDITFIVLWKPARDEIFDPLKNSPQHSSLRYYF